MVPQFIDVEDKIFGPITTRQFVIILTGGLLTFISFRFADTMLFIVLLALIGGLTLTFAFVKINAQPFHYFLLNILQNIKRPSRSVWNKYYGNAQIAIFIREGRPEEVAKDDTPVKVASHTRIRDLSLMVNTGGYYKGEG